MKYYLKEEFLHDNNVKNAGNKARNDVEEIVKREGYQALVLSVDNWYEMSTLKAQLHKSKAFGQALNQLKQGDELLIQFPMLHHSFFTTHHVKKAQKKGVKVHFIIHDLEVLRYANLDTVPLKHKIRVQIQESGLLGVADGIIAHNPIMKSVLVDKGVAEDKTKAELLRMRTTLVPSYLMSFLRPLRVVLGLSGMATVLRHVVVFSASTFAITTLTRRHFTWPQDSHLSFGNSQPYLILCLRTAVELQ